MEIYQFRQLIAIAEARSFRRAAFRLGLTQPALSVGIQKLVLMGHSTTRMSARYLKYGRNARALIADTVATRIVQKVPI